MDPKFDYNSLPYDFVHCFNAECERADKCLRRQMALRMPPERATVTVVNLKSIKPSGEDCTLFKIDQPKLFALGITNLLGRIPHNEAIDIKHHLLAHFGKTLFYRFWRREMMISPAQQAYIAQVFRQKGIKEAPVFDEYIEHYE